MRPQLEFATLDSGRIVARVGAIDVAEIVPADAGLVVNYVIRLPLPGASATRFWRANSLIEAKRKIWFVASEWFVAVGVMDINCRLRSDEQFSDPSERRRRH